MLPLDPRANTGHGNTEMLVQKLLIVVFVEVRKSFCSGMLQQPSPPPLKPLKCFTYEDVLFFCVELFDRTFCTFCLNEAVLSRKFLSNSLLINELSKCSQYFPYKLHQITFYFFF